MNILLVTETYLPYITGVSISTDSIARYMASRGHKVTLICPKPVVKGRVEPLKGLTIVEVPSLPFAFYNLNATAIFPFMLPVLEKLMSQEKFDVVHIQEPGSLGFAALIEAKTHHIPVIGALHFIPEQIDRVIWGKFEKILTPIINVYVHFIYNRYRAIMTPSFFFASYLKHIGVKKSIHVISNGVNTKKFKPGPLSLGIREKYNISRKEVLFFFMGRLDKDKNVETLVRAMPLTGKAVKLMVVGRGKEKKYLHKLAKRLKVEAKIVWVDYITDSEMPNYYLAADAFCIMSPYEGQSIVTLQAVATGLPLIAARAGALPELCHDGGNGFLVNTYDFSTLAAKMNKLATDKNLREKFEKESRQIALAHHKSKVLHKLELLYQKVAG